MKKVLDMLNGLSITWKYIFVYSAVMLIPTGIIATYLYLLTSNAAITQANMLMEQNILDIKSSILQRVRIIENVSQIVSYDQRIESFLKNDFIDDASGVEDYKFNILAFIDNISRQNKDIYTMRVYVKNPTIPEIYDDFYNIGRIDKIDWYKEFISLPAVHYKWRTSHESLVYIQQNFRNPKEKVFSLCRKVYCLSDASLVGIVEIEVREDVLFGVLRSPIISKMGNVFVVNREGEVVSDNIPKYYMSRLGNIDSKELTNTTFNEIREIDGKKSIIISIPAKEIDCNIVGIFPIKNFTGRVKGLIPLIAFVSLFSSLLLGLLVYSITNALLRRIKILAKAMKQVKDGNLNVSVEVKSKDEISELASSFNSMTARINDLVETVYKIQLMEREAELRALQIQINPHFLYNTLATISWAARKINSKEIYKISNSLARFYRLVLSKGNAVISVREEIEMVKAYLDIQKIRFEELFETIVDIDETVYDYHIVKNILQPLVENALSHGIEPKGSQGIIALKAYTFEGDLVLEVIDNGVGMDADSVDKILTGNIERSDGSGYAIKNIMERLKAYYDAGHKFAIKSALGTGTTVTIAISLEKVN